MARYKKIPDEWVGDWGLTWTEGAILADMLVWDCTVKERAQRCFVSERTVKSALAKFRTVEGAKIALSKGAKSAPTKGQKLPHDGAKSAPFSKEKKEIPPTPPIKNKKEKDKEEPIIILPSASDGSLEKPKQKKEKKYTPEEQRFHGELRDIFLNEWKNTYGDDYEWSAADMVATIKLKKSLKFKLKMDGYNSDDNDFLKNTFQHFIQKTLNGSAGEFFLHQDIKTIASKFNSIYTTLRNGKSSAKPTNRHQPKYSAEFLADIAAGLAGGSQDIG